MKSTRLLLGLLLASPYLHASAPLPTHSPQRWESADGRAIEARYLGRAPDGSSLVLLRADTGARVTVPLLALSPDSRALADTLPRDPAPPSAEEKAKERLAKLSALASAYPQAPLSAHPDVADAVRRYDFHLRALGSGDPAANARALRAMIARDLPLVAQRGNVTLKETDSAEERAKKRARIAAQGVVTGWLQALDAHASAIEKEAAK